MAETTENINKLVLTSLELKVLTSLIHMLYAEAGFTDVDANDLSRESGIPIKQIRGVISSLVKKNIIFVDESDGPTKYWLIHLRREYWNLHSEWIKEL
jgi:sugar-specific transcriptional regulator TrmB